ncbi:non-hydrolyzing UDP-N-acetylglucosamine 2-epimerase [Candidatus Latescibacterota bacterium]
MIKIICVCGARPNFIKIGPIMNAFEKQDAFETCLVHTGQHYDKKMSSLFFDELNIPKPDINLDVGSGSHAVQTAEIMKRFEPVVLDFKPDYVLVVGDVNSTIACGLVAVKLGAKLIHVEAGLRSFDRTMPEEINRILTDSISDLLFVSERSGVENLISEGVDPKKIHFVGNVMIDTLLANIEKAQTSDILKKLDIKPKEYAVITLHRPSNVDSLDSLKEILDAFEKIQKEIKLIFPIHPRSRNNIQRMGLQSRIDKMKNLILIDPVGYLDFLWLMKNSSFVMSDSGGIQEETTILGVSCMTLRENTERPVTVSEGTNRLVKINSKDIVNNYVNIMNEKPGITTGIPEMWDGKTAVRIVKIITQES